MRCISTLSDLVQLRLLFSILPTCVKSTFFFIKLKWKKQLAVVNLVLSAPAF